MINFIVYEDEKKYREKYLTIILKLIVNMKVAYRIIEINKYEKNTLSDIKKLVGKKIFILDIEVPGKSGLDLAREIRNSGDWLSPIIIVTAHDYLKNTALTSKLMLLDFISKLYNCEENLRETLKLSLNIITTHQSLNFQYNGELVQIPYDDILFIEKNVDDIYATVVTESERIPIKKSIGKLEKELTEDDRFYRTHRSYIVNIDKITSVELKLCMIHFGKKEKAFLSREKKMELKTRLNNNLRKTKDIQV